MNNTIIEILIIRGKTKCTKTNILRHPERL
jgi:hypothetical protein